MKLFLITALLALTIGPMSPAGCNNVSQEAARKASTELIRVQVEQNKSLGHYFANMENFLDAQLGITVARVDEITAQIRERYATKLRLLLGANLTATDAEREAIIAGVMKEINDDAAENEAGKRKIAELVVALKDYHAGFLQAQAGILQAQQSLDSFIQLKRVDELVVERTLDKVREKAGAATGFIDRAADALARIQALLKGGKAVAR